MQAFTVLVALASAVSAFPAGIYYRQLNGTLETCGNQTFSPIDHTCYNSTLLCPNLNGTKTLPCGGDVKTFACYEPSKYQYVSRCSGEKGADFIAARTRVWCRPTLPRRRRALRC